MVIKTQAVEPDTCDSPGCRYLELWDTDLPQDNPGHRIAAFERMCPAHFDPDTPVGVMLWWDGNWKPINEYIQYQRNWFLHRNYVQWLERGLSEGDMPSTIRPFANEPNTTGSLPPPSQAEKDALDRVYGWNRGHNARKNQAIAMPKSRNPNIDDTLITWSFSGHGDNRVLTVHCGNQLTTLIRTAVQNLADTQFGLGKVIIES